jgi:hypothetical protein
MPAPPKSDDPLPRNTIRLSDAFERYYRATAPDVSAVEAELNAALPGPESLEMWRCDSNWLGCLTGADYEKPLLLFAIRQPAKLYSSIIGDGTKR